MEALPLWRLEQQPDRQDQSPRYRKEDVYTRDNAKKDERTFLAAILNSSALNRKTKTMEIKTVEMHTGGEPLRIVQSGLPPIIGKTILEKRRYCQEKLDFVRKLLIYEPRGHFDMYGAYIVEPDHSEADMAVLFLHNEGKVYTIKNCLKFNVFRKVQ